MGLRFHRSVRVLPGIRLHLSQRGVSTTLGVPGLSMNVGRQGARPNVGLPGTGLAYRFEPLGSVPSGVLPDCRGFLATLAAWLTTAAVILSALARLFVGGLGLCASQAKPHLQRLAHVGHARLRAAGHRMSSKKS